MKQDAMIKVVLLISIVLLAIVLLKQKVVSPPEQKERFLMGAPIVPEENTSTGVRGVETQAASTYKTVDFEVKKQPRDCYPQDRATPEDLLPGPGSSVSTWAQANPMGQGDLQNVNFLTAGYHVGTNTVGQTKRNANLSLRTEIPNPRVPISPWNQSTIEPDLNRKPLDGIC